MTFPKHESKAKIFNQNFKFKIVICNVIPANFSIDCTCCNFSCQSNFQAINEFRKYLSIHENR